MRPALRLLPRRMGIGVSMVVAPRLLRPMEIAEGDPVVEASRRIELFVGIYLLCPCTSLKLCKLFLVACLFPAFFLPFALRASSPQKP